MKKASTTDIQKFHDAVQGVYRGILAGTPPTDAVIKQARALSYTQPWTQRLCEATNRLLAVDQLSASDTTKRAGEHPVVKIEEALAKLFPTTIAKLAKIANSGPVSTPAQYHWPVEMEKAAADKNKDTETAADEVAENDEAQDDTPVITKPSMLAVADDVYSQVNKTIPNHKHKALSELAGAGKAVFTAAPKKANLQGSNEEDILQQSIKLQRYFKQAQQGLKDTKARLEYETGAALKKAAAAYQAHPAVGQVFEERAMAWFDNDGVVKEAMDLLSNYTPIARFKAASPRVFTSNPWSTSPYQEFRDLVIQIKQAALQLMEAEKLAEIAQRGEAFIESRLQTIIKADRDSRQTTKLAGDIPGLSMLGIGGGEGGGKATGGADTALATAGLSPEDVNYMAGIQARQALVEALRDPVISRAKLPKLIQAYNKGGEVSPRAFNRTATLVPLLRQMLEQPDMSAHDLAQAQQVEKGLAGQTDPMNSSN